MSGMVNLYCQIYVDTTPTLEREDLARVIGGWLAVQPEGSVVENKDGAVIDVRKNDSYDLEQRKEFPDGFLYFKYFLEVESAPNFTLSQQVEFANSILTELWKAGYPAVAACDYEDLLSHNGGYKNANLPWPNRTTTY